MHYSCGKKGKALQLAEVYSDSEHTMSFEVLVAQEIAC